MRTFTKWTPMLMPLFSSPPFPPSLYVKNGVIKVNLGLCKGKKNYDKRDSMLEREHRRDIDRAMKEKYR